MSTPTILSTTEVNTSKSRSLVGGSAPRMATTYAMRTVNRAQTRTLAIRAIAASPRLASPAAWSPKLAYDTKEGYRVWLVSEHTLRVKI